jgi:hypothetical protein
VPRVRPASAGPAAAAPPPLDPEQDAPVSLDATAETAEDGVAPSLSDRAALILVARRLKDQDRQADIDRIHADFDANAAERAEYLRQMNVLIAMAMEQQKHNDEILKKWIAMI